MDLGNERKWVNLCSTSIMNSPKEGNNQLHQLSTGNHFLVEDEEAAQEVVIGLWTLKRLLHLLVKKTTTHFKIYTRLPDFVPTFKPIFSPT